jgi:MFS family permease
MVPEVQTALNISLGQIGVLSAFYYYAYTPMQIVAGAFMDRMGPRKLLINMVFLCALGSFTFAYTSSYLVAALAQFCIGFASAFAFVGVLKLASNWLPSKYFSLIAGLTTSLGMVGAMISNILIAYIMRGTTWRGVWYFFCIFGIVLMVIIYLICVNRPQGEASQSSQHLNWKDIKQDFLLMVGSPFFWINAIIGGLLYFPTTSFASLWGILYMTKAYGVSKIMASTVVSMIFLGWAVGGPLAGWLSDTYVSKKSLLIVGSLASLILISLALSPLNFSMTSLSMVLFLFGAASSVEVLVFDVAAKLFDGRSAGTAASLTNFILMAVCAILQPVIGFMINKNNSLTDYRIALLIIPAGIVVALLLTIFVYHEKDATSQTMLAN